MTTSTQNMLVNLQVRAQQAINQTTKYNTALRQTEKSLRQIQTQQVSASRGVRRTGNALQQASIQAGDFFVQIGGGQNALLAFSQQANQLGAFMAGPWGIAFTLATGLLAAFGQELFTTTGTASQFKEELQEIIDATDELIKRNERNARGVSAGVFRIQEALRAQRELLRINEATERLTTNTIRLNSERIELLRRIRALEAELVRLKEAEFVESQKIDNTYVDILGSAEGLRLANEALNTLYQNQVDKQREHLGLVQALGRQMINNIRANPNFHDPRGEGIGAGKTDYRPPDLGLAPVILPPMPTSSTGGSSSGGGVIDRINKDLEENIKLQREAAEAADFFGKAFEKNLGNIASNAIDGLIDGLFDAEFSFKSFAQSIMQEMAKMLLRALALHTIFKALGIDAGNPGNPFEEFIHQVAAVPFAKGGIVNSPTLFPMKGGVGLMGEAGSEAIMPLKRDSSGNLGVGGPKIEVNNYTGAPVDVTHSEGVISIAVGRAVAATESRFAQSMASGQGTFAKALERNYSSRRTLT